MRLLRSAETLTYKTGQILSLHFGQYNAAFSLIRPEATNVTVEIKVNFVSPESGEKLVARGIVLKPGKTLTICRSDVFSVSNDNEKLCATALATYMAVENR